MEVLYGKSKDFSTTMKVLTTLTDVSINEWEVSINDFNVEEAEIIISHSMLFQKKSGRILA